MFDVFTVQGGVRHVPLVSDLVGAELVESAGVVPVRNGIVEGEGQAMLGAGVSEHFQDILAVGSIGDFKIRVLGVPHAKSIVMLGRKAKVFHPGFLCQQHPFLGVEIHRVKLLGEGRVFLPRHGELPAILFVKLRQGVYAPVYKHSKAMRHGEHSM